MKKNRLPAPSCALDPDPPAVQLDELARDRQAESRAVVRARRRRVDLRELAEDQIVMLGRDADARVADLDEQLGRGRSARRRARFEPHAAAGRREVDRVAEQIADDVRDLLAIGDDRRQRRLDVDRRASSRFFLSSDSLSALTCSSTSRDRERRRHERELIRRAARIREDLADLIRAAAVRR